MVTHSRTFRFFCEARDGNCNNQKRRGKVTSSASSFALPVAEGIRQGQRGRQHSQNNGCGLDICEERVGPGCHS